MLGHQMGGHDLDHALAALNRQSIESLSEFEVLRVFGWIFACHFSFI